MHLFGLCTCDTYLVKPLLDFLKKNYKTGVTRDVINVEIEPGKDAIIFPYGVVVTWGLNKEDALSFIEQIKPFEQGILPLEWDEFSYTLGDAPKIHDDLITLPNLDFLTKLAISHGVAQSVELANFETVIQNTFNNTRAIPAELAKRGKINLSRREIRKKMGELFIERSTINLHVDVLDLPEFFWDHPELEPLYQMIAKYLDIQTRVEVLNHRLDIIHELYEVLANELNHQHSSRLELTIIILIVIEVVVSLARDVFQII